MSEETLPIPYSQIDTIAIDELLKRETDNLLQSDSSWIMQAFFNTALELNPIDSVNKKFSTAEFKYTNSALGGNFHINPPPQFTPYADIPVRGLARSGSAEIGIGYTKLDTGMGRYYSEAIDDNSQVVHIRFGVPQYNSLTQFFTGFYNTSAGTIARTGRGDDSFLHKFLSLASTAIAIAIFPIALIPLGINAVGSMYRFFSRWPSSKFYYLKPTMPLYWTAVSSMVNQIGVNKGIITYFDRASSEATKSNRQFDEQDYNMFNSLMGEIGKNGLIDVYALANKTKRMEMRNRYMLQKMYDEAIENGDDLTLWYGRIKKVMQDGGGVDTPTPDESRHPNHKEMTLESYLARWLDSWAGKADKAVDVERDMRYDHDAMLTEEEIKSGTYGQVQENKIDSYMDHTLAELAEGGQWASFRVDYTGAVSESFSNSFGESSLAQKFNEKSRSARDIRVNLAGGDVDPFGITKTVLSAVSAVVEKTADTLQIGGLIALAGNAFVDIPKNWESSSANLPKSTYTMTLISPYGNPLSHMLSIYIPLCMILAGGLPLATGRQSHTAPFMCELYDRGRSITKLGMIDSISVQRGTSNLGFNNQGQPMAIDVSFSIADMSSVVTLPIDQGFSFNPLKGVFDAENSFGDYLMTLSSLSLRDAEQRFPILKNQINKKIADYDQFFSASQFGRMTANLPGVDMIGALLRGAGTRSTNNPG